MIISGLHAPARKILIIALPNCTTPRPAVCCPAPTFWVHNISIDPFPAPPRKICFLPRLKQVYIQGAFFNCFAQISVLKRKTLFNQRESFVHREFHGTDFLIGCPSFFILVLKIGRPSQKNHPVCMSVITSKMINGTAQRLQRMV